MTSAELAADLRQFAAGVSFARPGLAWLGLAPPLVYVVRRVADRRDRLAAVARPAVLFPLVVRPRRPGRLAPLAWGAAWAALVVAAAGPRWGDGDADGVAVGRDVVILIDLSRSMTADDCGGPRWQAAAAGAAELVNALRPGDRAAVLAFAARPLTRVPLTTDADHLRTALGELDGRFPPAAVRPAAGGPSGTRLGAAVAAAVAAHDPRFPGAQAVVLFTDGDDPADDREWAAGVSAARAAGVPVHVVGVGDPLRTTPLVRDGQPLVYQGQPVTTRLREDRLVEMAAEGRGEYLPARRAAVPPAGDFYRTLPAGPPRELSDDARPTPRDRSAGFYAAGLGLLLLSWWRHP